MQPKYDAIYRALVTSTVDPAGLGRIKVQCPQVGATVEIRAAEPVNINEPVPNVGSTVWLAFSGGDITKPVYFSNSEYLVLAANQTFLSITSLTTALPDALAVFFVSGATGAPTGGSNPFLKVQDTAGTSAADIYLSGSAIKTNNSGTPYTWTTPTLGTGWANGTGVGGSYPNLQWRYDAENNIHLHGVFHATSTTPSTIVATGFPAVSVGGNVGVTGPATSINVANRAIGMYMNASGNLNATALGTIAVNDTFMINAKVPIGTIS